MDQNARHFRRSYVWLPVVLAGGIVAAASFAQTKPGGRPLAPEAYDYVGVDNSLLRVERDTGRVEILEQRNSPGMTLTLEQARPWTWREIRVDNRPGRPGDREPEDREPRGVRGPRGAGRPGERDGE